MTDHELQQHVQNALDWDPAVEATDVGVTVDNGVVTLRGDVRTYREKEAAERIALRVYGVRAVANDLRIHVSGDYERTDSDIAQAAVNALKLNFSLPKDRITAVVRQGFVTLSGQVDWQYQREIAGRVVRDLAGVLGVTNHVVVQPHVKAQDVQAKIEAALKRSAEVDARRIHVAVQEGAVTLTGNVRSWMERQEAERAAWAAPGVTRVDDRVSVLP